MAIAQDTQSGNGKAQVLLTEVETTLTLIWSGFKTLTEDYSVYNDTSMT